MERRGFFKSIAGLFVAAAVDPLEILDPGMYSAPDAGLAMVIPPLKSQMAKLTHLMHGKLLAQLDRKFPPVATGYFKVGDGVFNRCFGIDFGLEQADIESLSDEKILLRHIDPAVEILAGEINYQKATRFAKMAIGMTAYDVAVVTGRGLAIRGARAYDIRNNRMYVRFEVLFATA